MKQRIVLALCTVLFVSLSLALGQSKDDCTAKCTAASKASCCMHGAKASLSSTAKNSGDPAIVPVKNAGEVATTSDKQSTVKNSADCTEAQKANCDMAKVSSKAGTKANCCTMKAKSAQAKNATKKSVEKVAEAKGTN